MPLMKQRSSAMWMREGEFVCARERERLCCGRESGCVGGKERGCVGGRERERLSDIALGIFSCLSYETMLEFLKFYKASRMNPHIFYNWPNCFPQFFRPDNKWFWGLYSEQANRFFVPWSSGQWYSALSWWQHIILWCWKCCTDLGLEKVYLLDTAAFCRTIFKKYVF